MFLFMFSILSRRCPLLATSLSVLFCLLSMLISDSRFDLVWFRLSCDHGWIRSGSVNVRKQQQQQPAFLSRLYSMLMYHLSSPRCLVSSVSFSASITFLLTLKISAPGKRTSCVHHHISPCQYTIDHETHHREI